MKQGESGSEELKIGSMETRVWQILREVTDPELGINVVDLGLVYGVEVVEHTVLIRMTMTSRACPLNTFFSSTIENAIKNTFPEMKSVQVQFVWDPPWSPQKISEEARQQLGWTK